jgi:hypothetical protein
LSIGFRGFWGERIEKGGKGGSEGIPKMMEAIKSRVGILSKSKKLPASRTKEKFEEAKFGLDNALKDRETAKESFKGDMLAEDVAKGNTVKEKAVQVLHPWHARSSSSKVIGRDF